MIKNYLLLAALYAQTREDVPTGVDPLPPSSGDITVAGIIINIVFYILGFAAALALLFIVIGGILYITSGGDDKSVERARKYVVNAIIGLVIIILAFVIVNFVQTNVPLIIPER